ncbi:transmembrane emp24 domain-containing protein p24delta9-like [Cynara cardunculus var. scolymus]|uniref:transmembrane emp24 domain-containing protein p24delta9-like n=1 Tax=Cynara cardunculus var. scolymus TaxID=59895 RepID=UPI000D62B95E|nr:transmembrane emp24 domain-containing protein p24delta9-like [Cynara cardunculus var. scolymus]
MWRSRNIATILVMILGLASTTVKGMRFDLRSGATKCITEDIRLNAMTVGKYSIVNPVEGFSLPEEDRVTVRVTSPLGNNYHYADRKASGSFAFTAGEAGDYMACFWAAKQSPTKIMSIDFEWKSGLAAKDWSKVAKKGQVEMMELELRKLYDTVTTVHEEMFSLREREEEMQDLIRSTSSTMATFTFFSLVICLSVAGLQLWHLKSFFQRKKLI